MYCVSKKSGERGKEETVDEKAKKDSTIVNFQQSTEMIQYTACCEISFPLDWLGDLSSLDR